MKIKIHMDAAEALRNRNVTFGHVGSIGPRTPQAPAGLCLFLRDKGSWLCAVQDPQKPGLLASSAFMYYL
jgi:hypothetical protein